MCINAHCRVTFPCAVVCGGMQLQLLPFSLLPLVNQILAKIEFDIDIHIDIYIYMDMDIYMDIYIDETFIAPETGTIQVLQK